MFVFVLISQFNILMTESNVSLKYSHLYLPCLSAPDDSSLLLLRAELHLTTKNYEQALQDANAVCQREPLLTKVIYASSLALERIHLIKVMVYVHVCARVFMCEGVCMCMCVRARVCEWAYVCGVHIPVYESVCMHVSW